jgi:hypothetical protein
MDQEWKKQNQLPDSNNQTSAEAARTSLTQTDTTVPPPPPLTPSPPIAPVQPAAAGPAGTPDTLTGPNLYDQYNPGAAASRKKIVVSIIVLLLLVVPGGVGAFAFLNKKQPQKVDNQAPAANPAAQPQPKTTQPVIENKQPAIPISWKTVDTKLGYSLKVPADWSGGNTLPTESDFDIYKSTTITLGSLASPTGEAVTPSGKYISTGVQSITTSKTEADFEKATTDTTVVANALGLDKSKVNVTLSKLNISGKQWTQVDSEIPGSFSKTLYLWVNDHAVFVTISNSNKDTVDKYANDYLFPIAASVQLK